MKINQNTKYSWTKYVFAATKESLTNMLNHERMPEIARNFIANSIEENEWIAQRLIQAIMRGDFKELEENELLAALNERKAILEKEYANVLKINDAKTKKLLPKDIKTKNPILNKWLEKVYDEEYEKLLREHIIELEDWYNYQSRNSPAFFINDWQLKNAIDAAIAWHKRFKIDASMEYAPIKQENVFMGPNWPKHPEWKGWTIQLIKEQRDFVAEGKNTGHCIADYFEKFIQGTTFNFSLRNPQNKPKATFELDEYGRTVQIKGLRNAQLNENSQEQQMINLFMQLDTKKIVTNILGKLKEIEPISENVRIIEDNKGNKLTQIKKFTDLYAAYMNNKLQELDLNTICIMNDNRFYSKTIYYFVLNENNEVINVTTNASPEIKKQDEQENKKEFLMFVQDVINKLNNHTKKENFDFSKNSSDTEFQLYAYYLKNIKKNMLNMDNVINSLNQNAILAFYYNIVTTQDEYQYIFNEYNSIIESKIVNCDYIKQMFGTLSSAQSVEEFQKYLEELKPSPQIIDMLINSVIAEVLFKNMTKNDDPKTIQFLIEQCGLSYENIFIATINYDENYDENYDYDYDYDYDEKENNNRDRLLKAVIDSGAIKILAFLIENNINIQDNFYIHANNIGFITPLAYAAIINNVQICKFLINIGVDINKSDENPVIICAVRSNNLDLCKLFIENNADINAMNRYKESALHITVKNNNLELCKFLINEGINVNIKKHEQFTPLDYAIKNKNSEICELLINAGVTVTKENKRSLRKLGIM